MTSISIGVFPQKKSDNILIYKHVCYGQCNPSNYDSCGFIKDTLFDLIVISKIGGKYYKNGNAFNKQKADSLNFIININFTAIQKLVKNIEYDKSLKFVPPFPDCCEFEEYTIYTNKKKVHFEVFNNEMNVTYSILDEKTIEMFKKISRIIR